MRPDSGSNARAWAMPRDVVEGVVYDRNGVRVTAFEVDHGGTNTPAFGYRVEYAGRSVVISGDGRRNERGDGILEIR